MVFYIDFLLKFLVLSNSQNDLGKVVLAGILVLIGIVGAWILFRANPLGFLIILVAALLIGSFYYLFELKKDKKEADRYAKTTEGRVAQRLENCNKELAIQQQEINDIKKDIFELQSSLRSKNLNDDTRRESDRLLKDFNTELNLRKTKVEFYETCQQKLTTLLDNQKMTSKLADKRKKLNQLRERNYDDLAQMEGMKSEMEDDQYYLDSIDRLSLRILESDSVNSAETLQLELREITKELKRL